MELADSLNLNFYQVITQENLENVIITLTNDMLAQNNIIKEIKKDDKN